MGESEPQPEEPKTPKPSKRRRRVRVAATLLGAVLLSWGLATACAVRYTHVDVISGPGQPFAQLPEAAEFAASLDVTSIEKDVRYLASDELDGRLRGSEGNRLAREHLIARLEQAGLDPLFAGSFEQPTYDGKTHYGTNVGAIYRAAPSDAPWVALVAHFDHLGDGHLGADDNASAAALLLALADALGRSRPRLPRHVVLVFPDAEEPPDIRTERMGSSWFWSNPPLPLARLHLALVLDLMGGRSSEALVEGGLDGSLFVLGAEGGEGLARLARGVEPEPDMELLLASVASIEAMPYVPWKRYSRSDYHGLREVADRPFLFLTAGRTPRYHTRADTADTLDYDRMARSARYLARLVFHAAALEDELDWEDGRADPAADCATLLRLHAGIRPADHPWLLRRSLASDRERLEALLAQAERGEEFSYGDYRDVQMLGLRLQAAIWHPGGWWFSLF